MTENEVEVIESQQSQNRLVKAQSTLDEHASTDIVNQITEMIWSNIKRSISVNRGQPCPVVNSSKGSRFSQ